MEELLFQRLRALQRSAFLSCEAGMCRKASDRILDFTGPRAKHCGAVFGNKAFDSLCMIVLCCNFFK